MTPLFHIGDPIQLENFPSDHYFLEALDCLKRNAQSGNLGPYGYVFGIPFPFDPNYKRIGVNFSAGADSTILLCILCKIIEHLKLNTEITVTSVIRYHDTAQYSETAKDNLFKEVQGIYKNVKLSHVHGFLPAPFEFTPLRYITLRKKDRKRMIVELKNKANADTLYFAYFNDWIIRRHNLDTMYNGTTTNPVSQDIDKAPSFRNRKPLQNKVMYFEKHNIVPFALLEKTVTTALYKLMGLSYLFDMTHSCDDTEQGCGVCFHCEERQWSIDNKHLYLGETNEL